MFFNGPIICPWTGEDITKEVYEELLEGVNAQRLMAVRLQREAAKARGRAKIIRDEKGNAVAAPKAFIHPGYYFSVMNARRDENAYLRENDINTWEDPEFLEWELKNDNAIAPIIDKETRFFQISNQGQKAPVFNPSFPLTGYDL